MKRIAIAVGVQIAAGLVTGTMLAADWASELIVLLFIATGFSQCALLAIWGNFARPPRWKRLSGLGCGTIYLSLLVMCALGRPNNLQDWAISFGLVACPVSLLAAVLAVARKWRPGLEPLRELSEAHAPSSLQFSLRHIMAFAFVVAFALTAGRILRAMQMSGILAASIVCIVLAACLTEATSAALWASLSCGRVAVKLTAALGLAVLTGLIPPFYFDSDASDYLLICSSAVASQTFTIATLLAVRSCGYRLVYREPQHAESEMPGELVGHPLD